MAFSSFICFRNVLHISMVLRALLWSRLHCGVTSVAITSLTTVALAVAALYMTELAQRPSWLAQLLPMEGGQPGADARFEPGSTGGFLFPPPTRPAAEAFAGPTPSVDGAAGWGALVAGDDG